MRISRRVWGVLALSWTTVYLVAATAWMWGARGYPYGRHWDPSPKPISLLDGVSHHAGNMIMVVATAAAMLGAVGPTVSRRRGWLAGAATGITVSVCVGMIIVGDYRPLMAVARTPVYLVTHWIWHVGEGQVSIAEFVGTMYSWPALHGFWQLTGILLLLLAVLQCWRRVSDGCPDCGRREPMSWWTTRIGARRWGTVATVVAVICPLPYAISRYLLLFGIPADGFSAEQIRRFDAEVPGIWIFGAGLATFGVLGAILTLGLVQRWGERWPFWVPVLRGRSINPWLAIVPAGFVALLWPGSSLMFVRMDVLRYLDGGTGLLGLVFAPMNPWVFWGFSLAAATVAYWLRRRPDCPICHRGVEAVRGVWLPGTSRRADGRNRHRVGVETPPRQEA